MRSLRSLIMLAALSAAAGPAFAQQGSGVFVIRLGRDTTAVEKFTRTGTRLEADGIVRQPRTVIRHTVIDFGADGKPTRVEIVLRTPGAAADAAPIQRSVATFRADSVITETRRDTQTVTRRVALPAGGVTPALGGASSSFLAFELMVAKLGNRTDSVAMPVYNPGATAIGPWAARRLSRDSVWLYDNNDVFHARVDGNGRILGAVPLSGTQQFTVERTASADIDALARSFAARDAQGQSLGLLSPRDTVRATAAGAALWIDYSRPSKRGRVVFGSTIVPWGQVWRTGANAATQFRTDKALDIGGVTLQPGMYTLWTIPAQSGGWKLLINSETGQWGTAHNPQRDIYQLDMTTSTLPQPAERFTITVAPTAQGGTLNLDWDTTRATIPFTVRN